MGNNIELSSVILTVHWRYHSEKRIRFQGIDYARLPFSFFPFCFFLSPCFASKMCPLLPVKYYGVEQGKKWWPNFPARAVSYQTNTGSKERHSPASFLARSCRLVPVLRRAVQAVFSGQGSAPDVRTGQEPKPPPLASKTSSLLISPHISP